MPVKLPEAVNVAAIAGIAGLVSALVTAAFTYTSRTRELDIELVKVGIGILRADPKESQTQGAREWAIDVIETYSRKPFSIEARKALLQNKLDWGGDDGWGYDPRGYDPTRRNPTLPQSK
jgi:hypothetical protein